MGSAIFSPLNLSPYTTVKKHKDLVGFGLSQRTTEVPLSSYGFNFVHSEWNFWPRYIYNPLHDTHHSIEDLGS